MAAERIHSYEILEPVPRRGPGQAFRARVADGGGPLPAGSIVQLRVVGEEEAGGAPVLAALERDHRATARIAPGAVAAAADFGVAGDAGARRFWSASPWVEGRTLDAVLAESGTIPDLFVDALAKNVAGALTEIHRTGIAAIGLSPETLLLAPDTSVVLLDPAFGAAHAAAWPRSGAVSMSLACAAPETIRDRGRADERADLYSFGAALFRAMTGRWHRPDDAQALRCEPESFAAGRPSDVHPRLSIFLDELVFALLAPGRAGRPATSAAVAEILAQRRESAWWRGLQIAQESIVDERGGRARAPAEPPVPPIPQPVAAPDAAWIAERRRPGLRMRAHPSPMAGRADELRALTDASARLGARGGAVRLVEGAAGSGKTRLVDALFEAIDAMPAADAPVALAGEQLRLGIGRPMRAFSEALTRLVADGRDVEAREVAPLLADATAIAPAFAAFLSGREPPERAAPMSRETRAAAFTRAVATLCAAAPVVLVVENLQWADADGLDLFRRLARLAAEMPLLLVGTYRPYPPVPALAKLLASLRVFDHVATSTLGPFTSDETRQTVLSLVVPDPCGLDLAARIHAASDGSPLRVVETVRLLEAEGTLVRGAAGDLLATERAASAPLPATEEEIWKRRIALLGAADRAMLSMASVQGHDFDEEVARTAMRLAPADAVRAVRSLSAAALVEGTGSGWRFASHSLYDHVHDTLDDAAIESCHEATADAWLAAGNPEGRPPDEVRGIFGYRAAWHYFLAGRSEHGLLYTQAALAHLGRTGCAADAQRLAEVAARVLADDPARRGEMIDMVLARASFLGQEGRRAEERDLIDDALLRARDAKDRVREARALYESARLRFVTNQLPAATAEAGEALAAARSTGEQRTESKCLALLGSIAFREARHAEARGHLGEMVELARRCADAEAEAEALQTLGAISQSAGSFGDADEMHRGALHIYRRAEDLEHEAEALSNLANVAAVAGDVVGAEGHLRRALAIARAVADGTTEVRVLGRLGMVLQDAHCTGEARVVHQDCLRAARRAGARHDEVVALLNLATIEYVLGRLDEARAQYGDAMRIARELREPRLMGYGFTGLADVARQGGETEIARRLFERAADQFRECGDAAGLAAALLGSGRVEVFGGDAARAHLLLTEAREVALQQEARLVAAVAVSLLALLHARRGAADDAQTAIAESGALVDRARAGDPACVEMHFLHSLTSRVLGRKVEADRRILRAERLLRESAAELERDDRERVFTSMSPQRDIVAGADRARAAATVREGATSATAGV